MAWDGGPERVIALVAARLEERLNGLLSKQRQRLGLTTAEYPDLVVHADWPPAEVGLDLMPSIWVSEVQSSATTGPWRSSPSGVENVFTWRYLLGADVYLRHTNIGTLAEHRRQYALAVRTCLLYQPGLYDSDEHPADLVYYSATVRPELYQERYSNIGVTPQQAIVGGFTSQFQVDAEEQLDTWTPSLGPAWDVTAEVIPIPFTVPLPPVPPPDPVPDPPAPAPTNLAATTPDWDDGQWNTYVTWDEVPGAQLYRVYWGQRVLQVENASASIAFTRTPTGQQSIGVCAVMPDGATGIMAYTSVIIPVHPPVPAPQNVVATEPRYSYGNWLVDVSWDLVPGAARYQVSWDGQRTTWMDSPVTLSFHSGDGQQVIGVQTEMPDGSTSTASTVQVLIPDAPPPVPVPENLAVLPVWADPAWTPWLTCDSQDTSLYGTLVFEWNGAENPVPVGENTPYLPLATPLQPGETGQARVRLVALDGRTSDWSDPVDYTAPGVPVLLGPYTFGYNAGLDWGEVQWIAGQAPKVATNGRLSNRDTDGVNHNDALAAAAAVIITGMDSTTMTWPGPALDGGGWFSLVQPCMGLYVAYGPLQVWAAP